jgi:hypothetical protein
MMMSQILEQKLQQQQQHYLTTTLPVVIVAPGLPVVATTPTACYRCCTQPFEGFMSLKAITLFS